MNDTDEELSYILSGDDEDPLDRSLGLVESGDLSPMGIQRVVIAWMRSVRHLVKEIQRHMATRQDLDNALATEAQADADILASIKALVDKINAGEDFAAELALVNTHIQAQADAKAQIDALVTPPA